MPLLTEVAKLHKSASRNYATLLTAIRFRLVLINRYNDCLLLRKFSLFQTEQNVSITEHNLLSPNWTNYVRISSPPCD